VIPARFVARPNRFEVIARAAGSEVRCHLADPGRLKELLIPGAELRLRVAEPGADRKTRYTVSLVRANASPRPWVSVEAARANGLARGLLESGRIRGIGRGWELRREVRHGRSRFDFLLSRGSERMYVEVKSVSLVEGAVARFPDAPTDRGARHVRELTAIVRGGGRALVLFVVQRADALTVKPAWRIDPAFGEALAGAAAAGVMLRAARFRLAATGTASYLGPARVRLR